MEMLVTLIDPCELFSAIICLYYRRTWWQGLYVKLWLYLKLVTEIFNVYVAQVVNYIIYTLTSNC